jgi:hypothetical protein
MNASFWGYLNNAYVSANNYNDGTGNKYIATGFASRYEQSNGIHSWNTAPSGTAGNAISFTQAMTLDASGNLGIGQTSITSIASGYTTVAVGSTNGGGIRFYEGSTLRGQAVGNNNGLTLEASGALFIALTTNSTERARITSAGNVSIGGSADRGTTVGSAALQLFNGTAPAGTLTNGVSLYSSSGDLFFMDATGFASRVGFRGVPQSGSAKTGSYTLATTDVGEFIQISTGGSIVIPNSTFAAGDVVSLFNNTSGSITITCSTTNAYIAGTDTNKASMTLATRGVATILFVTSTLCVVSGNVT